MSAPHPRRRLRVLVLAGGGFSLVMGLWTGLARAGVHAPVGPVGAHGVLMVLGFLGTLIALERAVALRARWAFGAPILSAASMVALVAGVPTVVAGSGLTVAGGLLTAAYVVLLHHRVTLDLVLMGTGAVAWVVAATLWAAGWSPVRLAPTLAAFLVFTIVGERLELSRLRQPSPGARRRLVLAAGVFGLGAAVTLVDFRVGLVVAGLGLAAQASWLLRHDVARVTIRRPGLPRFAAACLLSGHAWLAIGGVLWMALGLGIGSGLILDAAVHAVFLGFAISMVMGHAPIILPAVLGVPLPHRTWAWLPVGLLHVSVALRIGADLVGSTWLRGLATHGNVTALLLFVGLSAIASTRASTSPAPSVQVPV